MWWPTHARASFATQTVLFSSPPAASSGRGAGTGSASAVGTAPRERRTQTGRRRGIARMPEPPTPMCVGAAGEVGAAEALDRDDAAGADGGGGLGGRVGAGEALVAHEACARTARRAGDRLGVEAAVGRVLVLGATGVTEREGGHRRPRA